MKPDPLPLTDEEQEEAVEVEIPAALKQPFSLLTGIAGTGKTFLAKAWAEQEKGLILTATTGIAAVNLGEGTTINSLLSYFDTASLTDAYVNSVLQARLRKLRKAGLRRILLDEVSMLDGQQLTHLTRAIEEVNTGRIWSHEEEEELDELAAEGKVDLPQIALTLVGDFAQLPPVKAPFAFESEVWDRFTGQVVKLTEVRRQDDQDFVEALNAVRRGDAAMALEFFADRLVDTTDMHFDGPTLLAKNDAVERFNLLRLGELRTSPATFSSSRWGKQRSEWKQIPETLHLKEGALVMILANCREPGLGPPSSRPFLYVNGDLGTLVSVEQGKALVELQRTEQVVAVFPVDREVLIPLEPGRRKELTEQGQENLIKERYEVVGGIRYVPLRCAYATTVHKCVALDTRIPVHGRGYLPAGELEAGETTPYGTVLTVARTTQASTRIRTKRGYGVVCSPDHRWMTRRGFVATADLRVGEDALALNQGPPFPGADRMSGEQAWTLGALVGDGCYTDRDDGTVEFACTHKAFGKLFWEQAGLAFKVNASWRKDQRGLNWTSQPVRQKLLDMGLGYLKGPCKRVPYSIWGEGPANRGAFLRGLYDTDGHIGRNRIILTTASPYLAEEVQELLLTLGIVSRVSKYRGVDGAPYHQVYVGAEHFDLFLLYVDFAHPEKRALARASRPNRALRPALGWDVVTSVEPLGLDLPMIDVELEAPHTLTFGPFLGHNSQGLSLDKVQVNIRDHFFQTPGMLYVALSRARNADGLRVVGQAGGFAARCSVSEKIRGWL